MAQYCRYCANLVPGDLYCYIKGRCLSESVAKRWNTCPDFEFNEIDAITLSRVYEPRGSKEPARPAFETMPLPLVFD